jgi:hypothetical protein
MCGLLISYLIQKGMNLYGKKTNNQIEQIMSYFVTIMYKIHKIIL